MQRGNGLTATCSFAAGPGRLFGLFGLFVFGLDRSVTPPPRLDSTGLRPGYAERVLVGVPGNAGAAHGHGGQVPQGEVSGRGLAGVAGAADFARVGGFRCVVVFVFWGGAVFVLEVRSEFLECGLLVMSERKVFRVCRLFCSRGPVKSSVCL